MFVIRDSEVVVLQELPKQVNMCNLNSDKDIWPLYRR